MKRYPLHRPVLGLEEAHAVAAVLESGHLVAGKYVAELEKALAQRCGTEHAVTVSSGTAALHASCTARGVAVGDGVVVPAFGYPATANAVELCGGRAQAADVSPDTFSLTAQTVLAAADSTTVGVLAVHPFGIPAPLDELAAVCESRGWWLIEDAACALGTTRTKWARFPACLSFHPRKTLTTAEGGAVVTNDADFAATIRILRNQGVDPRRKGWQRFVTAGFNYRLSDVHAAIGVVQMNRLDEIIARRRQVVAWYREHLAGVDGVRWPSGYQQEGLSMQSLVIELLEQPRDAEIARLRSRGIETTIGGYATFEQPYFVAKYGRPSKGALAVSHRLAQRCLTLPVTHDMEESDVRAVTKALADD